MTAQEILFHYTLRLGDNNLILGQRLGEWCGHGPALEEDIAITNIALDILGAANSYLQYAAKVEGAGKTEDQLAMLRLEHEYQNVLLVELPNGDFAHTLAKQFLYDTFNYFLTQGLTESADEQLKSIAHKSLKEITYHIRHSREWMLRLGDGTEESHLRLQNAINELWPYTSELFTADEVDEAAITQFGATELSDVKANWLKTVSEVLSEATIEIPKDSFMHRGGKKGIHTEHMGYLLADMQYMQRAYPNMEW